MNDRDIKEATIAISLWFAGFSAGMVIASEIDRAFGLLLMAASTIILAVVLLEEYRIERKQDRINKLVENDSRQLKEACENGECTYQSEPRITCSHFDCNSSEDNYKRA